MDKEKQYRYLRSKVLHSASAGLNPFVVRSQAHGHKFRKRTLVHSNLAVILCYMYSTVSFIYSAFDVAPASYGRTFPIIAKIFHSFQCQHYASLHFDPKGVNLVHTKYQIGGVNGVPSDGAECDFLKLLRKSVARESVALLENVLSR